MQAFDSEGNVFSSLEGLRFNWTAKPEGILKIVPISSSAVQTSNPRREIEKLGWMSDVVELNGLSTGVVTLSVKIFEPGYEAIEQDVISMHVVESLYLEPELPTYIAPHSELLYILLKRGKGNAKHVVTMPSKQYKWFVSNSTTASVDKDMGSVTGTVVGRCDVIASDQESKYIKDAKTDNTVPLNAISAVLHVVEPSTLDIVIYEFVTGDSTDNKEERHPIENWYLIEGRKYVLTVEFFGIVNGEYQRITLGKYVNFDVQIPLEITSFIWTVDKVANGLKDNQSIISAAFPGTGDILAELVDVKNLKTGGTWKPQKKLEVKRVSVRCIYECRSFFIINCKFYAL